MTYFPVLVFVLTLFLVIKRPKGLGIGYSACLGALVVYLLKFVNNADIFKTIDVIWNAVLAFVALIIISYVFNEIGIFKWAAHKLIIYSKNKSKKLFTLLILLGAMVSALFANDGAALILTPIVIAKMSLLNVSEKNMEPFVMGCGFIADSASILLITSNLVNIIAADYFEISYSQYALLMLLPFIASVLVSLLLLQLFYRKQMTSLQIELKKTQLNWDQKLSSKGLALLASFIILIMFLGCFVGGYYQLPVSLILMPTAVLLAICAKQKGLITYRKIFQATPFSIIFFAFGMFLLVLGLEEVGLTSLLERLFTSFIQWGGVIGVLCNGALSALLSCVVNNLPAIMLNSIALANLELSRSQELLQVFATVIGCDIGPKLFPIGSLATLLWMHLLEKQNISVSYRKFIKVGFILTWPTLIVTLVVLYFSSIAFLT